MYVRLASQAKLCGQINLGPADDLAAIPVDDSSQQFTCLIIQQPNAIGGDAGIDRHRTRCHDVIAVTIIRGGIRRFADGQEKGRHGCPNRGCQRND
jgi:hypothetical protein